MEAYEHGHREDVVVQHGGMLRGKLSQGMGTMVEGARCMVAWQLLLIGWLAGWDPKSRLSRTSTWRALLRAATLHWRVEPLAAGGPDGRPSMWVTLHTSVSSRPGPPTRTHRQRGDHLVDDDVDATCDKVLKVVDLAWVGAMGRMGLVLLLAVPVLPEMALAWAFFCSTYLVAVLYALSHARSFYGLPLLAVMVMHVPLVWLVWFPIVAGAFTVLALVSSMRTWAYLTGDALKIISWLTENKYSTTSPRLHHQ